MKSSNLIITTVAALSSFALGSYAQTKPDVGQDPSRSHEVVAGINTYSKQLRQDANNPMLHWKFANFLAERSQERLAVKELKEAIRLDSSNREYWAKLGEMYLKLHDYRNAVIAYKRAGPLHEADVEFSEKYAPKVGDFDSPKRP